METITQESLRQAALQFVADRPDLFSCPSPVSFSAQLPGLPPEPVHSLLSRLFPEGVYLHGAPGAGKSRFLRQLLQTFTEPEDPIPLYFDPSTFTPEQIQSAGTPQMAVFSQLTRQYFPKADLSRSYRISRILDFRTASPRFLLWVDGLHRTPATVYPDMLEALACLNTYPNLWVVVTGRNPDPAVSLELTIPREKRRTFPLPNQVALLPSVRSEAPLPSLQDFSARISAAITSQDTTPLRSLECWFPKLGPLWCNLCSKSLRISNAQILSRLYDLVSNDLDAQSSGLRLLPRRILESFPHTTLLSQSWGHLGARLGDTVLQWALGHRTWLEAQPDLAFDRDCQVHICWELANSGDSAAQFHLARTYDLGRMVPHSTEQAILWYTAGASQNHPWCAYHLGRLYESSGDRAQAIHWLRTAARQRLPQAAFSLSRLLLSGTPEERQEALEWHKDLERQSDLDSLLQLGCLYWLGDGVEQDFSRGTAIFRSAVTRRSHGPSPALSSAQLFLSYAYFAGLGVQKDIIQARYWQEKSRTGYYSAAQTELGLYFYQAGRSSDALHLFRQAWISSLTPAELPPPSPEAPQHTRLFLGDPDAERRTRVLLALRDLSPHSSDEQEVPLCFT